MSGQVYADESLATTVGLNGSPPPPAPPPSTKTRTRALIAGSAIALVAIVITGVVLLTGSQSSHSPKVLPSAVYQQKLSSALTPLVSANQALSNALESIDGQQPSLTKAEFATTQAQAAVASAQGAIGVLTVPASQASLQQQTEQALTQENGYLQAVSATLQNPIGQSSSQLQTLATSTQTALIPLNQVVPGASSSISDPTNLLNWVAGANAASKRQSAAKPPATTTTIVQQVSSPASSGLSSCDQNIQVNSDTSCPFAENVFVAYWNSGSNGVWGNAYVTAYSPATGLDYTDYCSLNGTTVSCSHGSDLVVFPLSAVQAY